MIWYKYSDNKPPDRVPLLGRTDEGEYKIVKFYKDKFDTYHIITHYAIIEFTEEKVEKSTKRGRPKRLDKLH